MISVKNITDAAAAVTAFEPDIAIALTAYTALKTIWMTLYPGKTEADFQAYLQTSAQTNVDTTAVLLAAHGFVETPAGSGNWAKPTA
jgi:hypothetical protein